MSRAPDIAAAAAELIAAGRALAGRGFLPATSGNLSRRLDARYIAVTASGAEKGALTTADVLLYDLEAGTATPGARASAETPLHASLYRMRPEIGAVLHTHSRNATLISMLRADARSLTLADYELLKAFRGFTTHEARAELPIFANDQDMDRLAARVESRLGDLGDGFEGIVGYLLAGHGLYTWGVDMAEARRHIEAIEFMLDCELERMRLGR